MSEPRQRLFFSAMMLLSLLAAWLAGEALIFACFQRQISFYPRYLSTAQYGEFRLRGNQPGAHYRHRSYDGQWEFRINRQGFRDERDFTYAKNPQTYRILVLGDSFTLGYEARQEDLYSAVLERELKRRGYPAEVINAGVSGFSTAEELVFLAQEGLKYAPDLVLVGYFVNDPEDNVRSGLYALEDGQLVLRRKEYLPYMGIRGFLNRFAFYRWLAEHSYLHTYLNGAATRFFKQKVHQRQAREIVPAAEEKRSTVLETYQTRLTEALMARIGEIAREAGIPWILMDIPVPALESSLPAGSAIKKMPEAFLDASAVLRPYAGRAELYRPHGTRHWTEFSHRLAGEALADLIEQRFLSKRDFGG